MNKQKSHKRWDSKIHCECDAPFKIGDIVRVNSSSYGFTNVNRKVISIRRRNYKHFYKGYDEKTRCGDWLIIADGGFCKKCGKFITTQTAELPSFWFNKV